MKMWAYRNPQAGAVHVKTCGKKEKEEAAAHPRLEGPPRGLLPPNCGPCYNAYDPLRTGTPLPKFLSFMALVALVAAHAGVLVHRGTRRFVREAAHRLHFRRASGTASMVGRPPTPWLVETKLAAPVPVLPPLPREFIVSQQTAYPQLFYDSRAGGPGTVSYEANLWFLFAGITKTPQSRGRERPLFATGSKIPGHGRENGRRPRKRRGAFLRK